MFDEFPTDNDTATQVQGSIYARLAAMPPEEKLLRCFRLSDAVRTLVLAGIRDRYPQSTADELRKRFAAITLGREFSMRYLSWDPEIQGY